jgi:membrane protease YdiL (CAAX protease family)
MLQLALFIASVAWVFSAQALAERAGNGIAVRFDFVSYQFLLAAVFFIFLLWLGFSILQAISFGGKSSREVLGLPRRPTVKREWAIGVAVGWSMVVAAVLPMALAGTMHIQWWTAPRAFWLAIINLATIAAATLAEEIAFRGYPFRRLIEAMGPVGATVVMSILFGLIHAFNPAATWSSVLMTMLAGVLLCVAWLRTHGLWIGWGLHFGWNASMGVLFGLPVSGFLGFSSVVQTRAIGRAWLTGGDYGPEAALFTGLVLLVGIGVLARVTRDYAWHYTYEPIVAGGYPMDAPPPAEHTAMEQQARPAPLVQILPATPQSGSAGDEPKA